MSLKKRFENYTEQPDPKVWESVNNTLHHKIALRRSLIAGGFVVLAAIGSVIGFTLTHKTSPIMAQQTGIAEHLQPSVVPESTVATNPIMQQEKKNLAREQKVSPSVSQDQTLTTSPSENIPAAVVPATVLATTPIDVIDQPQTNDVEPTVAGHEIPTMAHNTTIDHVQDKSTTPVPTVKTSNFITDTLSEDFTNFKSFIPTAISPDNGTNAGIFRVNPKIKDYITIEQFKMYIYNRGGRMVFHSTSLDEGWNGISNGSKQPYGSYVYIIEYRDGDGKLQRVQGSFILVR